MHVYGTGNIHRSHNYLRSYKILGLCCVAYLLDVISPNNGFKQKLKVLLSEVPAFTSTRTAIPERFFG